MTRIQLRDWNGMYWDKGRTRGYLCITDALLLLRNLQNGHQELSSDLAMSEGPFLSSGSDEGMEEAYGEKDSGK